MKQTALNEAVALSLPLLAGLLGTASDAMALPAAQLRQDVGSLSANLESEILAGTFATSLAACFADARVAGASFDQIGAIRAAAEALVPVARTAQAAVTAVIQLALACQCRIVADTIFASRDQVDSWRTILDAAFDAAIDAASDDFDQMVMVALTSLRAAVMRDLTARARPLPQIVSYAFSRRESALVIATRLYGDGGRYQELIAENAPVHPLFMPAAGRALSR